MIKLGEIIFGNGQGIRWHKDDQINASVAGVMPALKAGLAAVLIVMFCACLIMAIVGQATYGSMPFEWQYQWREFLFR